MRVSSIISLGFMPSGIIAQDVFEPADFNVTEALLANGVNVSGLPELSEIGARSILSGCSITEVNVWHAFSWTINRVGELDELALTHIVV
jgi:hypothetical protein